MKNNFAQLLIDIQKKSGITVERVRDVKSLKEEIETVTQQKIGYNTLRRFYGFLPHTIPSKATLTLLSKYLGFNSYSSYISNKLNYDEWYFQQKLLHLQLNGKLDADVIALMEIGLINKNNSIAVANFISHLIEHNDIKGLQFIFNSLSFQNLTDSDCLKFSTIVTFRLLTLEKKRAIEVYKALVPLPNFRNLVPLYYIDYTHLVGIYTDVLALIQATSSAPSDVFFVRLMQYYKSYFTATAVNPKEIIALPTHFATFHPVLKGRYLGYLILKAEKIDKQIAPVILNEFKRNQVSLLAQEVIATLIVKEAYQILALIFDRYYEDLFETSSWSYKTTDALNLIGLANVNWYRQNYVSARRNLELVELDKVELGYFEYISIFYYLTLLKISFAEQDAQLNDSAYQALSLSILKTKFVRFEIEMKKYLLERTTT